MTENKSSKTRAKLTKLKKIFWTKEGYTKGDVIKYYDKIAEVILPYLKGRPQSLNRHPNGIKDEGFFQKNVTGKLPNFAKGVKINLHTERRKITSIVANNRDTLLYLANLGCIEINPWHSRIGKLDNPDYAIIDLDPGKIGFDKVIEAAQTIRKVLEKMGVQSFPKTSGKTGLHIFVPLGAKYTYEQSRQFAEIVVTLTHKQIPGFTSLERNPAKRSKKIYLDYLQNSIGQTAAAAYSLRPHPGATVSAPLLWKEVKRGLDPADFNIKTIFKRLEKRGDIWKGVLGRGVNLERVLSKIQHNPDIQLR